MIKIPNFIEIFRSNNDGNNQLRGIIIFVKTDVEIEILNHIIEIEKVKNIYHGPLDLISFKFQNIFIITGYKSPTLSNNIFKDTLRTLLNSTHNNLPRILIGDFNVDLNNVAKSFQFKTFLSQYELQSLLPNKISTTNFETQIDVIFSNIKNYSCGTYESYFSDHKPIFIEIPNKLFNVSSGYSQNTELIDVDKEKELSNEFNLI